MALKAGKKTVKLKSHETKQNNPKRNNQFTLC